MPHAQSAHRADKRNAPRVKKLHICGATGKARHTSQESAILHVAHLKAAGNAGFGMKVYRCVYCPDFHVGHVSGSAKAEV